MPEKNDFSRLVYCAATIQEVQRFSGAIPVSIPHTATKDLVLEGYSIKKDDRLIINIQKIMKDHRAFKNPDEFNPERFIENDLKTGGKKLKVLMRKNHSNSNTYFGRSLIIIRYFLFYNKFFRALAILFPSVLEKGAVLENPLQKVRCSYSL